MSLTLTVPASTTDDAHESLAEIAASETHIVMSCN